MKRNFFPGREPESRKAESRAEMMRDRITVFTVQAAEPGSSYSYAWVDGCEAVDLHGRWYVALGKAWFKAKLKIKIKR